MAATTRTKVLGGYRRVLVAAKALFQDDEYAYKFIKTELKSHFIKNKAITDLASIQQSLRDIDEAEDCLKNDFIQARMNERGNYQTKVKPGSHVETLTHEHVKN